MIHAETHPGTAGWASLRSRPILDFAGRHYFGQKLGSRYSLPMGLVRRAALQPLLGHVWLICYARRNLA